MNIDEIKEEILPLGGKLSKRMKKYMHYQSMRNFVLHFDEIKTVESRAKIADLLHEYIQEARENNYDFIGGEGSLELATKYLSPISKYYRKDSNFMRILLLKFVLAIGIIADGVLYLTGFSAAIWHIPIVTIGFLLYYLFILLIKKPKGRVYGIFY